MSKDKEPRRWTGEELSKLQNGFSTEVKCPCGYTGVPAKPTYRGGFMLICTACGSVDGFDVNLEPCKKK